MTTIISTFDYDHLLTTGFSSFLNMNNNDIGTLTSPALFAGLQKFHIKKERMWLAFLFLKNEMLFCRYFLNHVLSKKVERENLPNMEMISSTLEVILDRLRQLKDCLQLQECKSPKLLGDRSMEINKLMTKSEDNILNEIHLLSHAQKLIKEDLWTVYKWQQLIQPLNLRG